NIYPPKPPPHLSQRDMERHPHWRRLTPKYRRKKEIVKDLWIGSGLVMIVSPLGLQLILLLVTTLVAFMILDETS
ncbi:MAG: hypothetical protein ABFS02_07545, partial [Pseudomonadota bacterium]